MIMLEITHINQLPDRVIDQHFEILNKFFVPKGIRFKMTPDCHFSNRLKERLKSAEEIVEALKLLRTNISNNRQQIFDLLHMETLPIRINFRHQRDIVGATPFRKIGDELIIQMRTIIRGKCHDELEASNARLSNNPNAIMYIDHKVIRRVKR